MIETIIAFALVGWVACGVIAYGLVFAHFQQKWPLNAQAGLWNDRGFAALVSISGPLGLSVVFFKGWFSYGLQYRARKS